MRDAEAACFQILEHELAAFNFPGARIERRPINPAIQTHPAYSLLHFTKTAQRLEGLSAEETYAQRCNLLYIVPGINDAKPGASVALNAHIDVVAPYLAPRLRVGVVYGRGACDDKGPVVSIVAALKVLSEVLSETKLKLNRNIVGMFVVEEETGGNGSLSLALDRELKQFYDAVLVAECTGLKIYPANRGAVWYRAELNAPVEASPLEMAAFVVEEMEKEGIAIRAESHHPLFPQRPVQTCHGMIGRFGEHPSRICGQVTLRIDFDDKDGNDLQTLVKEVLEASLAGYVGLYGDKTKVMDASTCKPVVGRHYRLHPTASGFKLEVYGASGHMGAIRERDGAITKAAHLMRGLVFSREKLESRGGKMRIEQDGSESVASSAARLVLEGGQGFVPTHRIEEIMTRLRNAAQRGAESYLRRMGLDARGEEVVKVTYEKLHNVAFDGDPDSLAMRYAIHAAKLCGLWSDEPVLGWTVSCDARLFATEYPGMPVLTFGPGHLVHAHSDEEQIAIDEIGAAAEFLAIFLLLQTGTL
jgi:acetylornithine deacetylase/succinyl-diaminopimelate desuccinylase-like protein